MQAWAIVEAGDELPDNGRTMATDKQEREEGGSASERRMKEDRRTREGRMQRRSTSKGWEVASTI